MSQASNIFGSPIVAIFREVFFEGYIYIYICVCVCVCVCACFEMICYDDTERIWF